MNFRSTALQLYYRYYSRWSLHRHSHNCPRNYRHHFSLYGYDIDAPDCLSLYYEYQFIFLDQIYHFPCTKKSPLIIDGGGFIGMSTLYFKHLYPKAKIIAFEPDPSNLTYFQTNVTQNHLHDIQVHQVALSKETGFVTFASSRSDESQISKQGNIKVPAVKLSHYLDQTVDFLKLNIEGMETEVIEEAAHAHKLHHVKHLCIEWHSFPQKPQDLDRLLATLTQQGFRYTIHNLSQSSKGMFSRDLSAPNFLYIYAQKQ